MWSGTELSERNAAYLVLACTIVAVAVMWLIPDRRIDLKTPKPAQAARASCW